MAIKQFLSKAKKLQEQQHHPRKAEEKRSEGPYHDESNWLVSYADMMTLLCAFFIMLFSMAHLDERKYEMVKESVAKKFGGEYKSPSEETAKFVTQVIQEMGIQKDAVVRSDASGVAVTFESTLFFDTLSSDVKKEGQAVLDKLIQGLASRQKKESRQYRVVVEGHTDSRPITAGSYPSNWELSSARAARVVRMFLERGFSADHMTAIGYADTYPVAEPRFPDGRYNDEALAKNRRVVVRIMDPKTDSIPFPEGLSSARNPASLIVPPPPPAKGSVPELSTPQDHRVLLKTATMLMPGPSTLPVQRTQAASQPANAMPTVNVPTALPAPVPTTPVANAIVAPIVPEARPVVLIAPPVARPPAPPVIPTARAPALPGSGSATPAH